MNMKLIIFGATGGTGRQLVRLALDEGYAVTAFARRPERLEIDHPHLRLHPGDVLDPESVRTAIIGHDAVLSALGAPPTKTGVIRSEGTRNIIDAMEATGIQRFVCMTSLGYGDSRPVLDATPFYFKHIIVPLLLRKAFADHEVQEGLIQGSKLDWTIVRPGSLTDGERTGQYRHGFAPTDRPLQVEVSRADVADFMLKQLKDTTYLKRTTGLSY